MNLAKTLAILSLWGVFICSGRVAYTQSSFAPINDNYYHLIDRYEIKRQQSDFQTTIKPYGRQEITELIEGYMNDSTYTSIVDDFNISYLLNDNSEFTNRDNNKTNKATLKFFYKNRSDLYHVEEEGFDLHFNLVSQFSLGSDKSFFDANPYNKKLITNTRGVEVRGMINKKIGFYSYIGENQVSLPTYDQRYSQQYHIVPGSGFWKSFTFNHLNQQGYDYLNARGYITFNIAKYINFQAGHDKLYIGDGIRSLILSDASNTYNFVKLNTNVWKINYTNIFAEMRADVNSNVSGFVDGDYTKKFITLHRLGVNLAPNLNIGAFESIIFGREDTLYNHYEIGYLNPIILYRSLEQQGGSMHNASLGLDFKWNFLNSFSAYGQFYIDEFVLSYIKARNGWKHNKYAGQLGLKYIDVLGISNLDLQVEHNFVRPYTYSHKNNYSNYSHYLQPLAHPLGANFKENLFVLRAQPWERTTLNIKLGLISMGRDTLNTNYGGDILKDYTTAENEFNNTIAQGLRSEIIYLSLTGTYHIWHNIFMDARYIYRKETNILETFSSNIINLSLRWNIGRQEHIY